MLLKPGSALFFLMVTLSACTNPQKRFDTQEVSATTSASTQTAFNDNAARWELINDQDQIKFYRSLQAIPGRISIRSKVIVASTLPKIATALIDPEIRKKWFLGLLESRILRVPSDFQRVYYETIKAIFPYLYADFIYQMTFSVLRDPTIPLPPETSRGDLRPYYFARAVDSTHFEVVLEFGVDTKGGLPPWNQEGQAKVTRWFTDITHALQRTVEDPKLKVSKEVIDHIQKHGST